MQYINSLGFEIQSLHMAVFFPLILSFLFFNAQSKAVPLFFVFCSVIVALLSGVLVFTGLVAVIFFGLLCFLFSRSVDRAKMNVLFVLISLLSLGLMGHFIFGFNNPKIITDKLLSPGAEPISKYLNFDKAIVGIFLLLYVVPKPRKIKYVNKLLSLLVLSTGLFLTFALGLYLDLVDIDIKLSFFVIPWLIINLFFTCYVEEAFFRGVLQQKILSNSWAGKYRYILSMLVSGGFFGIVHASAGVDYVLLATILGFVFSYIYIKTRNIYWPIFAHFIFNLSHVVFFTYPYILR